MNTATAQQYEWYYGSTPFLIVWDIFQDDASSIRPSSALLNSNILTKVDGNTSGQMFIHAVTRRVSSKNFGHLTHSSSLEQQSDRRIHGKAEAAKKSVSENMSISKSEKDRIEFVKTTPFTVLSNGVVKTGSADQANGYLNEAGVSVNKTTDDFGNENLFIRSHEANKNDVSVESDLTKASGNFKGKVDRELRSSSDLKSTAVPVNLASDNLLEGKEDGTANLAAEQQNQEGDTKERSGEVKNAYKSYAQEESNGSSDDMKEVLNEAKEEDSEASLSDQHGTSIDMSQTRQQIDSNNAELKSGNYDKNGMIVPNEILIKSFTTVNISLPFERDCRHNRITGAIECIERTRNSPCSLTTQQLQCPNENIANITNNIDACRKFKIIEGKIYDLVDFPCRQVIFPIVGIIYKNQRSSVPEMITNKQQEDFNSMNLNTSSDRLEWKAEDAAKKVLPNRTIAVELKSKVVANENSKKDAGKPFHMNCGMERDDFSVKCRDWALAGYCMTNNATRFLWCRKTCLCVGPPHK
ncbi:Uncharacterized protein Tcan_18500 [Toxocara canis]|uniref:ShKT domain-containing protein n=1 Tax=Toxocara canis TaxID=6265 RepID=A0A0B2VVX2_TOXCA|nr:Uncharacterized protein Tcan_18500 [Toxocara canis]